MLPGSKQTSTEDAEEGQLSTRTIQHVTTTVLDLQDLPSSEVKISRQRAKTAEARSDTADSKLDEVSSTQRRRMFTDNVAVDQKDAARSQLDDIKHILNRIATGLDPIAESDEFDSLEDINV